MKKLLALAAAVLCAGCPSGITCPADEPVDAGLCTPNSVSTSYSCEWGGDSHGYCTTIGTCAPTNTPGNFSWTITPPIPECTIPDTECPAAYGPATSVNPCEFDQPTCEYPEGVCGCVTCPEGASTWYCRPFNDVAPGCPVPRQKLGTSCTNEGLLCNYDSDCCGFISLGPDMECAGGFWIAESAGENGDENGGGIDNNSCSCTPSACQ